MGYKNAPISSKYDSFNSKNTPFTGILLRKPFVFHMIESRKAKQSNRNLRKQISSIKEKQRG
ncbi:ABC transporter ATP-binding protein [Bacillus cereus]|nr:ABC transporter ATP-binding protein [Bacillus cereus]